MSLRSLGGLALLEIAVLELLIGGILLAVQLRVEGIRCRVVQAGILVQLLLTLEGEVLAVLRDARSLFMVVDAAAAGVHALGKCDGLAGAADVVVNQLLAVVLCVLGDVPDHLSVHNRALVVGDAHLVFPAVHLRVLLAVLFEEMTAVAFPALGIGGGFPLTLEARGLHHALVVVQRVGLAQGGAVGLRQRLAWDAFVCVDAHRSASILPIRSARV